MAHRIIRGDCLEQMRALAAEGVTVQAIVTDPPYEMPNGFMGKSWDRTGIAFDPETWRAAYDLLPPGGHLVAFGSSRGYHRLACAIEDAGFEIRDSIWYLFGGGPLLWTYGCGFPKSLNVSKSLNDSRCLCHLRDGVALPPAIPARAVLQPDLRGDRQADGSDCPNVRDLLEGVDGTLAGQSQSQASGAWPVCCGCGKPRIPDGLGTQLKPAVEPICLARKPLAGTVAQNVQAHGTGALNVDGCRVEANDGQDRSRPPRTPNAILGGGKGTNLTASLHNATGRWPANLCHDGSPEVEAAFAAFGVSKSPNTYERATAGEYAFQGVYSRGKPRPEVQEGYGDTGTASRFFAKCEPTPDELRFMYSAKASKADRCGSKHPCVKPVALMRWLVRMVCPPGGTVLDPFVGSGTTLQAAHEEGFNAIGIECDAKSIADAQRRMDSIGKPQPAPKPVKAAPRVRTILPTRTQQNSLFEW